MVDRDTLERQIYIAASPEGGCGSARVEGAWRWVIIWLPPPARRGGFVRGPTATTLHVNDSDTVRLIRGRGALTGCDRNLNAFVVGGVVIKPRPACVNAAHRLESD